MLQVDELVASHENTDTGHENLSLVDIQELIKQEKCEAEELPSDDDLHRITEEQFGKKSEASPSKNKKPGNAKRARSQKPSKVAKKKVIQPATQYERLSNRELIAEMITNEIMESKVCPVHTCKFCHRNFSSAFILCLHIQIHEKVNRVSKMSEQKNSAADSATTLNQIENTEIENVNMLPNVSKIENVEMKNVNTSLPVNKLETKKADSLPAVAKIVNIQSKNVNASPSVSKIINVEKQNTKSDGSSSSSASSSRTKIKTEAIDECDSISIKTEPVSFVKNNFVENLKKNLSLAMNRKL